MLKINYTEKVENQIKPPIGKKYNCNKLVKCAKNSYNCNLLLGHQNNLRKFWNITILTIPISKASTFHPQGSTITLKSPYLITYVCQILAYMTYVGKYQKAETRHHTFYLVIFLTIFLKLFFKV